MDTDVALVVGGLTHQPLKQVISEYAVTHVLLFECGLSLAAGGENRPGRIQARVDSLDILTPEHAPATTRSAIGRRTRMTAI